MGRGTDGGWALPIFHARSLAQIAAKVKSDGVKLA